MLGIRVKRERAEDLRRELAAIHLVDKSSSILDDGPYVEIPILDTPAADILSRHAAVVIDMAFPRRHFIEDPIEIVCEQAEIPSSLKPLLPHKWERFGDVVILRLDHALDRFEEPVARAYASVLGAKTILRDIGGISGEYRQPVVKFILGTDAVTTHVENGIKFRFDASKIMFSSGNQDERTRMASLKCDGETIVDMFAGIGYFSIPIAVRGRPKNIVACELNPIAYEYLEGNIRLNGVESLVKPVLGDNRELAGEGIADRIVMGYVRTTHEFLSTAVRLLKSGGVIHYHETCPRELMEQRPIQHIVDGASGNKVVIERFSEVKSFAPGVGHVVVDARIFKPS